MTTKTGVLIVALTILALGVSAAHATAPGANGDIAYRTYFDVQQTWGAIFRMHADGSGSSQITHPRRGIVDDQPSWPPDGSLISFTRCKPNQPCHAFFVKPDGPGAHQLGKACAPNAHENVCPDDGDASFSPNSRTILFTQSTGVVRRDASGEPWIQHSALTVMSRDGQNRHVVFRGRPWSGDLRYGIFSPNGKQIVFEWDHSGFASPPREQAVFVVGVDGHGLHRLTPWSENDGDNPDWSPDGQWILFHSHVDDPTMQSQFFLIHPDGTGRQQITHFPVGTHVASATFAPDGKSIVYAKGPVGGNVDVYTIALDGTNEQRLTQSPLWESAPAWGPATP